MDKKRYYEEPSCFAYSSKRRRDFPSETHMPRGQRTVNGNKDLTEKLGRNDPCPRGSWRRFQKVLHATGKYDGSERHYYF